MPRAQALARMQTPCQVALAAGFGNDPEDAENGETEDVLATRAECTSGLPTATSRSHRRRFELEELRDQDQFAFSAMNTSGWL